MNWVKRVLSFILSLSMCFTLFSFYTVFADSGTYVEYTSLYCFPYTYTTSDSTHEMSFSLNSDARLVQMVSGTRKRIYMVSLSRFTLGIHANTSCTYPTNYSAYTKTVNNTVYYYSYATGYNLDLPEYEIENMGGGSSDNNEALTAIYYTYGDGAVDPDQDPIWGNPANVMFNTRIAGSGNASSNNIDRIVWSPDIDSNSNPLPTSARVQIRAIPGKYVSNSKTDLLTQTYNDFVIDHSKAFVLTDRVATGGVYEIKWGEVVDHFQLFPYSWVPDITFIDNEYFKMGWIYQIRLQIDDYYSDWINIYNATSAGVSVSDSITDSDTISQELIKNIEIVNTLNQTTTNWYINETTINMQEYQEPEEGDKPWWAYLLEAILGGLNITNNYFENGNGDTQLIVNTTNNYDDDLNIKLNEYNDIEDQQIQNLDDSLEAIDTDSEILSNNKFINSANWVTQQYNRMTNGTVIGSLIGFSLLFGLALIFIGKIR